jgi:hypothetical protein
MKTSKLFTSVLVLSSLAAVACGSSSSAGDDSIPPNDVSGNGNAAAPDASVPANCDVTRTPAQDGCVVNETLGIFVAPPQSSDGGTEDGTRAHPFSKMQTAIDTANTQKKRVYACVGNYAEQITLADGVSIFGDLDCAQGWNVTSKHAVIQPPASPAVRVDQITSATRVDSVDMIAPDATTPGGSSIALIANDAAALTIANATIHAGKAMNGADGVEGVQLSNGSSVTGANGVAQYEVNAAAPICSALPQATNTCVGADGYQGGAGGAGGWGGHWVVNAVAGGFSSVSLFQTPSGVTCLATRPCVCSNQNGGDQPASASTAQGGTLVGGADPGDRPGVAGIDGASGANGADGVFAFNATGFVPGDGVNGGNGAPGQGGGGGMGLPAEPGGFANGTNLIGSGGAGGGAGGCPGLAGTAGHGGGASVAILANSSPMTIDSSIVESSAAGDGGKGTFGSAPTSGGQPGANLGGNAANAGAAGGNGGASGWSGSGAGGPSIAIVSHGAAVVLTSTTPTFGTAGHGVAAMTSGSKTIPASADGVAAATQTF